MQPLKLKFHKLHQLQKLSIQFKFHKHLNTRFFYVIDIFSQNIFCLQVLNPHGLKRICTSLLISQDRELNIANQVLGMVLFLYGFLTFVLVNISHIR